MRDTRTFVGAIRHAMDSRAEHLAWATSDVTMSYEQLRRCATRHATVLAAGRGSTGAIAVICETTNGALPLVLGALLTGRAVVLLPNHFPEASRQSALRDTGCSQIARPGIRPDEVRVEECERTGTPPPGATVVFCTSGSTGHPKLVPLGDPALVRFADWAAGSFGIGSGTRVLSYAPLNFDLSLLEVWTTLYRGGTVVGATGPTLRDSRRLAALMAQWRPDVVQGVPVLYERLARGLSATAGGPLTARHVLLTGDNTPRPVRRVVRDIFPTARYHNVYGSTETNDSMVATLTGDQLVAEHLVLGDAVPGADIRLLGEDRVELDGPGIGELYVSTPFQTTGYIDPDGRYDGSFVDGDDIGSPAAGRTYFRSRDLVERLVDGSLRFVGRRDFRIKVHGVSVDLEDVEDVVLGMDAVVEAVALPWAAGGEINVAVMIRTDPYHDISSVDVRQFCASRVEPAAVPFRIVFVDQPLPRTSTGKVDRGAAVRLLPSPGDVVRL